MTPGQEVPWEFDDDLKEDLDPESYARIRSTYEKSAGIPAGTQPPDTGKAELVKARRRAAPVKEAAPPAQTVRQTRVSARRVAE
jgi:hypothetical protein